MDIKCPPSSLVPTVRRKPVWHEFLENLTSGCSPGLCSCWLLSVIVVVVLVYSVSVSNRAWCWTAGGDGCDGTPQLLLTDSQPAACRPSYLSSSCSDFPSWDRAAVPSGDLCCVWTLTHDDLGSMSFWHQCLASPILKGFTILFFLGKFRSFNQSSSILGLTMDHMTLCNVQLAIHNEKLTDH